MLPAELQVPEGRSVPEELPALGELPLALPEPALARVVARPRVEEGQLEEAPRVQAVAPVVEQSP